MDESIRFVKYNGGTISVEHTNSYKNLEKGRIYKVKEIRKINFQINLVFEDISGEYDSSWFDEYKKSDYTFAAEAREKAVIGKNFHITVITKKHNQTKKEDKIVIPRKVEIIGKSLYKVDTYDEIFYVLIG